MRWPLALVVLLAMATAGCASGGAESPAQPSAQSQPQTCARPTDSSGRALYQTASGPFAERRTDAGGGRFVVITPPEAAANQAYQVTQEVYEQVRDVARGRRVTLFGYVSSAASGANPTYSCIEF